MIDLMLLTFRSGIHCCVLLSCSFVRLVFIGSNDPNVKERKKERKKERSKTVSRWKIIFVAEHIQSNEGECAEDQSLPAKGSPLLETSGVAGKYFVWCSVCVCVCVWGVGVQIVFCPCQI